MMKFLLQMSKIIFKNSKGEGKCIVIYPYFYSVVLSSFLICQDSVFYHFLYIQRISFSKSFREGVQVTTSLKLSSTENAMIFTGKDFSLHKDCWVDSFFFQPKKNTVPLPPWFLINLLSFGIIFPLVKCLLLNAKFLLCHQFSEV